MNNITLNKHKITNKNKFKRLIWGIVYFMLYRPSPIIFHRWRCFLLRLFGAKIGTNVAPYPTAKIWAPWNLEMHDNSCLASGVICYSVGKIIIGKDAVISQYTHLCSATHDYKSKDFDLMVGNIEIGEKAWICAEVFVGPGVKIGAGCVANSRSFVGKNLSEWSIYSGNPAKFIRERIKND